MDNKCNLSSHERACERKIKHKQKLEQSKDLLLYCKVCSTVMDNKKNLLKHEQICKKNTENKQIVQKKKTCTLDIYANKICQLQLNNHYDQTNSEHDNVCLKRKQVKHKIRDRQYEKSKLQLQLDTQLLHHNKKKSYTDLENQLNSLNEQVTKLRLLLEQLAQEETELYNRKCGLQQEMKQLNDSILTYEQTRSALTEHTNQIFKTSEILNNTNESKIGKKDKLPIDDTNF